MIDDQVFILHPERTQIDDTARVDRWVKIEGTVNIGRHVHIASFSHIGAGGGHVEFGDYSGCSSHVVICSGRPALSEHHISAADLPENQHPIRSVTQIGEHVVIFAGAVILPGVMIGDYAVIGAGAVVTKDVPPYAIVMGVPGRVVGKREDRGGVLETVYYPKLRDVAGQRDINLVRAHYRNLYGTELPEPVAADLAETLYALTAEMMS